MQTTDFSLKQILMKAKDKEFGIPQFQREFRWNSGQIKLLIDSVARNYPVGSLLMMSQNSEIELAFRSVEAEIGDLELDVDEDIPTGVYYILDGQQRLTSIARVFLNADPKRSYYFDLKAMINAFEQDDPSWIIGRMRGKDDKKTTKNGQLLRTDVIMNHEETDVFVSNYIEDSGDIIDLIDDKQKARRTAAKVKGVFETIRNYRVPIVVLDRDTPLESICRVFETINSTGTRLTTFDLAVAKFYPNPDLRNLWENAQAAHPILQRFEVDGERALQVLSLWHSHENKKFTEPTRSKLLSLDAIFIGNRWEDALANLAEAYQWAERNGASPNTLANHGILVALAAFFAAFPKLQSQSLNNHAAILRKWYFSRILQSGARAANYIIGQDFDALVRYATDDVPLEPQEVKLNVNSLHRIRRSADNMYKALHCVMAMNTKEDLLTGSLLIGDMEDHHIYPRSLHKTQGFDIQKIDAVTNRILISRSSNSKLSDTLPEKYFARLQKEAVAANIEGQVKSRLEQCLIPGDISQYAFPEQFSLDNFDNFLDKRAELILDKVKELIGGALKIEERVDDE